MQASRRESERVRDLVNLGYEIHKKTGENKLLYAQQFFKELRDEISKEIEKGTDLSSYLSVSFNVLKREYEIKLVLPARTDLFDASISDKRGDEKSV